MSYSMNVPTFIDEIRKNPEIWDTNLENHNKGIIKMAAWGNVARCFISDFDELNEEEKDEIYRKLSGKWRNIRDSYVRNRKKKYCKRGYMYADSLKFLEKNFANQSSEYDDNETQDTSNDGGDNFVSKITVVRTGRKTKPRLELEVVSDSWHSEPPLIMKQEPDADAKNSKCESNENSMEYLEMENMTETLLPIPEDTSNSIYQADSDNKFFFDSLLPAVRDFNIDQRLEFRCEVMKLIKKVRSMR